MELGVMDLRASPIPDLFAVAEVRLEGFIAQNEWQSEYTVTGGFRGRLGWERSGGMRENVGGDGEYVGASGKTSATFAG
jgi:hypothetical protein